MKQFLLIGSLFVTAGLNAQNYQWAKSFSNSNGFPTSILTDATGNVYTAGHFSAVTDFDPGTGVTNLTPLGSSDCFISNWMLPEISSGQFRLEER